MEIIKCPLCGKEVSEKAVKCVHCGLELIPNNTERKNMSPKDLFIRACAYYDHLITNIKIIGRAIETNDKIKFSTNKALMEIDYILQYILLKQAMIDGDIDSNEIQFIQKISEHGDLMNLIYDKLNLKLKWSDLKIYKTKVLESVLKVIFSNIIDMVIDFIFNIAAFDAVYKKENFYVIFRKDFLNIAECLSYVDSDMSDNEGHKLFDYIFGDLYLKRKKEIETKIGGS